MNNIQKNMDFRMELLKWKHDVLLYLDAGTKFLNLLLKALHSEYSKEALNIKKTEEMLWLQIYLRYAEIYYERIALSDNFAEELYHVLHDKPESSERKQKKLDTDICAVCGRKGPIHAHHLIPVVYGGSSEEYNLIPVCPDCHRYDPFEYIFTHWMDK